MWALWPTTTLTIPGRGDDVKTLSPSQASDGLEQPGKLPKRHAQASAVPGEQAAIDEIDAVVQDRRRRAKDGPDSLDLALGERERLGGQQYDPGPGCPPLFPPQTRE